MLPPARADLTCPILYQPGWKRLTLIIQFGKWLRSLQSKNWRRDPARPFTDVQWGCSKANRHPVFSYLMSAFILSCFEKPMMNLSCLIMIYIRAVRGPNRIYLSTDLIDDLSRLSAWCRFSPLVFFPGCLERCCSLEGWPDCASHLQQSHLFLWIVQPSATGQLEPPLETFR